MCVRVCVWGGVRVCARARARVCVCVRACVRACVREMSCSQFDQGFNCRSEKLTASAAGR